MTTYNFDTEQVTEPLKVMFLEWCLAQPEDRPICHTSWENCAVGDFARAHGFQGYKDGYEAPPGYRNWSDYTREHVPMALLNALDTAQQGNRYPTYGRLAQAIRAQYVVSSQE
ncbi:hypothetical protein [Halomonas sp. NO4]|uniref:hypothetical protein n=1 Tax=Halomonas sp. NO4 TaxID=2484813 RepID=UPI0013D077EA|nr:hypothetical protein [Halomonas sp. NO4]